jgi:hypothetical protein
VTALYESDLRVLQELELYFDPVELCRGGRHQRIWLRWCCICCHTDDDGPFSPR